MMRKHSLNRSGAPVVRPVHRQDNPAAFGQKPHPAASAGQLAQLFRSGEGALQSGMSGPLLQMQRAIGNRAAAKQFKSAENSGDTSGKLPESAQTRMGSAFDEQSPDVPVHAEPGSSPGLASRSDGTAAAGTIQRMPTSAEVTKQLGKPKMQVKNPLGMTKLGKKIGMKETIIDNSTRYRSILDKLDQLGQYVATTRVGNDAGAVEQQLERIKALYKEIETALQQYADTKEESAKAQYFAKLAGKLQTERAEALIRGSELKRTPPADGPLWSTYTSITHGTIELTDSMSTNRSAQGGINEVKFFRHGRTEGAFKANKNQLADLNAFDAEDEIDSADMKEGGIAADFGIATADSRTANRDVAMSRLDRLLGGNTIAKAELAVHRSGGTTTKGSFMEKAPGREAGKLGKEGGISADGTSGPGVIDINDKDLQRCLSRLQLIDTLAMQADRHQGNYFIDFDASGNVIGVTGIDNDMSFGTRTDIKKGRQEYPGLSRYVDKELAERIIALNPEDLSLIMTDLLSPAEIDALIERLTRLQAHLKQLQSDNKLLTPNQWNDVTAGELKDDQKGQSPGTNYSGSYYGKLKSDVDG